MKLLITGASGFVARQIIPELIHMGVRLVLAGRKVEELRESYPKIESLPYESLSNLGDDVDAVLHLAIKSDNESGDLESFRAVNVDFLKTIVAVAQNKGIKHFIYPSSLHAQNGQQSAYARSKVEAEEYLQTLDQPQVHIYRLATVYGAEFAGKLRVVEKSPCFMRAFVLHSLQALRPTVNAKLLATEFSQVETGKTGAIKYVTNTQLDNPVFCIAKRAMDLLFSLSVIFFLWWLLLIIWLVVKLTSPGPGIFSQTRIGWQGKTFTCYKFRTMHEGTRQAGTHELSEKHVTKIGAFLRKTKLDELPQVFNILKNELSLVGPRPCLPVQKELIHERQARGVDKVLPGITGLAQIQGVDMSTPVKLATLDAEYISLQTLFLDIKIIIATLLGRGQGDHVNAKGE